MGKTLNCITAVGRGIPGLFVGFMIAWSYYAMMFHVFLNYYQNIIGNLPLLIFLIVLYNIITILFVWSWLKTVFTPPATIKNDYKLSNSEYSEYTSLPTSKDRNQYLNNIIEKRHLTVYTRLEVSRNFNQRAFKNNLQNSKSQSSNNRINPNNVMNINGNINNGSTNLQNKIKTSSQNSNNSTTNIINENTNLQSSSFRSPIGHQQINDYDNVNVLNDPNQGIRFCRKSQAIKPDRSHYDSMTQQVVLKMDHYCPWVANCIGYSNYKFFVLFLFYATMYTLTVSGIAIKPFLTIWNDNINNISDEDIEIYNKTGFKLQTILVFLVASVFSVSIMCLFFFHVGLVSKNRSTLECYGAPILRNLGAHKNSFDLGVKENWRQVFGSNLCLALIPVDYDHPDLDGGHKYPLNQSLRANSGIEMV